MRAALLLMPLAVLSCSSPATDGPPGPVSPQGTGPDLLPSNPYGPPPGMPPPAPQRCSGLTMSAGDQHLKLMTPDGRERVADVHVPLSYDPTVPTPLVVNLHGFLSNPWEEQLLSAMNARADARHFIVAYPQGSGQGADPLSWNAYVCCPPATMRQVDDVGFIRMLLDRLSQELCIDQRRIYATGMSNGGFMSHRLACELSDRIAAVAPVAGQDTVPECRPKRPVPVMHFHGTKDPLVPYQGGTPLGLNGLLSNLVFPSVAQTISGWVERNGCQGDTKNYLTVQDSHCDIHPGCRDQADVILCTVDGGGHCWPGGSPVADIVLGYTTPYLHATDLMIDFFFAHPMP